MTATSTLPPARERTRDGLPHLEWSTKPTASDAWPDKIRIKVQGHLHWGEDGSFYDYVCRIAPSRLLRDRPTVGRSFKADVNFGSAVTGILRINMVSASTRRADELGSGDAKFTLHLNLNPTATRVSAVRRNSGPMEELTVYGFFNAPATASEIYDQPTVEDGREHPLDGSDNVLLTVEELGGQTTERRRQARDAFLAIYERKLRDLVHGMLDPSGTTSFSDDAPPHYRVEVEWGSLLLERAEIYFERRHADPVALVRRMLDRGLDLARRIKAQRFADAPPGTTYALEQSDGFPHIITPLTGKRNVELSIYAKTDQRVRFEVRYKKGFGGVLRDQSTGGDRLASLLERLAHDATKRLPWKSLGGAASVAPDVDVAEIAELVQRLVAASERRAALFRPLVREVIMTGGIIADDERHPGIERAIRALVRDCVLEHLPLQLKEQRSLRRYGLTARFSEVRRKMLSGFVPVESGLEWGNWEAALPADHFEEAASYGGGRHMVHRPL